ncbi:MAG TPA: class I tRNA ligase family protein, partial [Arthrobacter sp.]|nr:class I tRNA ligase family protein [Arthrobacter sp.]
LTNPGIDRPNAEKAPASGPLINPLDRAVLAQLSDVVTQATKAFEAYDYARALQITESFFWHFTDDYVELIKDRAYGAAGDEQQASVLAALATSLDTLLRLFAPFLPFATEEVWGWWRTGSVHRAQWPAAVQVDGDTTLLATVGAALGGIRKAKSEAKVKQRTEVLSATITASGSLTLQLQAGLGDLKAAANARGITLVAGEGDLTVGDVVLAPADAPTA